MQIIRECCALTEDGITAETEIKAVSLDSLSFIQLIVSLETEFGIEFDDERLDIYAYEAVNDVISAVEELANAGK
jgi:acyl carrier protein